MNKRRKPMKQLIITLILSLLLPPISATATKKYNPEEKGLAIVREADRRGSGYNDFTADMLMSLRNKHGRESIRRLRIKALEVEGDGDKSLTIFDNPKDVKGTAFLNFTHKVGDDDQWLYLPALKRVKRISSRNKTGSFMGSEFSYEDIASQEVEKYTYKWIRDKTYDYTRQVSWIDRKHYRTLRVEYFDRKDSHLKTLTFTGYQKYLKKYWRADEMNMVNHQNGKSTRLKFLNYKFRTGLKDRDFNKNSLKRVR
jgi:outer membrane lipoprotein-sorting protein